MKIFRCGVIVVLMAVLGCESQGTTETPHAQTPANTINLSNAVKSRRVITFTYKNHTRTVEPHAQGTATEDKPALLAWQSAGESSTIAPPGWRVFLVDEIQDLKIGETQFTRRKDYHEGKSRGLKTIDVEAPPPEPSQP